MIEAHHMDDESMSEALAEEIIATELTAPRDH